jgi:hypothetical protein
VSASVAVAREVGLEGGKKAEGECKKEALLPLVTVK